MAGSPRFPPELEAHLDDLTDELLSYVPTFDKFVAEGMVDEKRRFVRAFVKQIDIEPGTREAEIWLIRVSSPALADLVARLGPYDYTRSAVLASLLL